MYMNQQSPGGSAYSKNSQDRKLFSKNSIGVNNQIFEETGNLMNADNLVYDRKSVPSFAKSTDMAVSQDAVDQ